jgi:hypothetical protein
MAREAGNDDLFDAMQVAFLERFEALVRADERTRTWTQEHWTEYERSIAAVEREAACDIVDYELDSNGHAEAIKIAIRARKNP